MKTSGAALAENNILTLAREAARTDLIDPKSSLPDDNDDGPLYVARRKIYPKAVKGFYRRIKWIILCVTLAIYYFTPFIRWNRGVGAPDQAVLLDLDHGKFYFFFIEIWSQEIYYITGLLILASLILFLMNAVAGRVWCGYLCPQTVWTDLFFAVERLIEGDQREQLKLKAGGWTLDRFSKAVLKHWIWMMIAWWTGGAWVLYFSDAPTLVKNLLTFQASASVYIWIAILTSTTYLLAGHMREQVCTYMCPWPRIQAALTDEHALNVMYRYDRGEPRVSFKKSVALRNSGELAGDCVDCYQCVAVCPTGIDIRDGAQLECIQCGLCIDACDEVMGKLGRNTRLIAYDNDLNLERRKQGLPNIVRLFRARTIVYTAGIALVGGVMLATLISRNLYQMNVIHDKNPIYVQLSDGAIRNAYTIRILNKSHLTSRFTLTVEGLVGAVVDFSGATGTVSTGMIEVGPDQTREIRTLVTVHGDKPANTTSINFSLVAEDGQAVAHTTELFKAP